METRKNDQMLLFIYLFIYFLHVCYFTFVLYRELVFNICKILRSKGPSKPRRQNIGLVTGGTEFEDVRCVKPLISITVYLNLYVL